MLEEIGRLDIGKLQIVIMWVVNVTRLPSVQTVVMYLGAGDGMTFYDGQKCFMTYKSTHSKATVIETSG